MIDKLSAGIVSWLQNEGSVTESETELYRYAVYSFIWGLLPFVVVAVWGIIFDALWESILLILPFMLIRKFCGGYHLSKPSICFATSSVLLGVAVWGIKSIDSTVVATELTIAVILAVICICAFSPVDSNARRLTAKEIRVFGNVARAIAIIMLIAYLILVAFGRYEIAFPVGVGIILPACLQIPVLSKKLFIKSQRSLTKSAKKRSFRTLLLEILKLEKYDNYIV